MDGSRLHPRYALEIDAEIAFGGERFPARTRNVSGGGLSVLTDHPVPVGQEVTVAISLLFDERPMSEPVPLRGRVVWCTPLDTGQQQVGVTFVGLTGDQRVYLELFMRYVEDA